MISMKMCLSSAREHHSEAWGSPRSLKRRPQNFKVLPWRPLERSLGAPGRLNDDLRADLTPSRIHCYGQCFQHIEMPKGRPESQRVEQRASS